MGAPGLFVLLVILPLGLAGVSGDLILSRHARSLAESEARQMARTGLALALEEGPEAALRTLEGVVGYEAAIYRNGTQELATDPGFGPASLGPEAEAETIELEGRLGVSVGGPDLALLAAASTPRAPGATYPGGPWGLIVLILVVLLPGGVVLSRVEAPGIVWLSLVAGPPLILAWTALSWTCLRTMEDAEAASSREVGLPVAIARDLGASAPVETLSRLSGLRTARLEAGGAVQVSWQDEELTSRVRGLPRPPADRTITGYLTTSEERLRYAASRFDGGTTVFLAPAPEIPPRGPGLQLLLVGLAVAAGGVAFVILGRSR